MRKGDCTVSRANLLASASAPSCRTRRQVWYPSLMVPGHRRMFTSVGEHGMVATPPCSWSFSTTWFFHAGTHVLQRHMAPSLHHFLFLWKTFYSPCFFAFSVVQAALWHTQPCTESKGTILYMPFDVVYYLFCVYCYYYVTWVVEHGMVATYPSLFLKFFHQLIFPCRHTCSSETLGTISTSQLVFVENMFTSLVSLLVMEFKLHSGKFSPVFVIIGSKFIETNAASACRT